MSVRVGQRWHSPVRSMQAEPTDEVIPGPGGAVGDRAYGFVDVEAGRRLVSAKRPTRYAAIPECRADFTGGRLANVMMAMASALRSRAGT